ncbi:MAG: peptidoglycan-binding protein [Hyphomonas sp.]
MSQSGPWTMRGFDQRAREAAREAAMAEGISLVEYLSRMLSAPENYEQEEAPPPNYNPYYGQTGYRAPPRQPEARPQDAANALERLSRRIEASEARSTLAITGIDHTVLGLVARIQNSEQTAAAVAGHVEGLIEEMRATHEALQAKVRRMEQDEGGKQNLEALKALESALGKLASHVYEEAELTQNETQAIKGRVEAGFGDLAERVEGMEARVERKLSDAAARVERAVQQAEQRSEGAARDLTERMGKLEDDVQARLAATGNADARISAVEEDVSGALTSMEATLLRVQERLNRAETTTDAALKGLESTFASLDERIDAVAKTVDPELAERLRTEFEARFEDITRLVRSTVDNARQELASEIARTAEQDSETETQLRTEIGELKARLADVEARDPEEMTAGVREEIERLGTAVSERIDALAEHVDNRIEESEIRSAEAIEQVGEQVTVAAVRLQKRQDESLAALAEEMDANRKQTDARLSDALASVSERLEDIHEQSVTSISPVQRAIAALASRLESLEAFSAPPDTPLPPPITLDPPQAEEAEDEPFEAGFEASLPLADPIGAGPSEADEGEEALFDETAVASGLAFEDLMAGHDQAGDLDYDQPGPADPAPALQTETAPDLSDEEDFFSDGEDTGEDSPGAGGLAGEEPERKDETFASGFEDWEDPAEATAAPAPEAREEDAPQDDPYGADFNAIRAAVERLSTVRDQAAATDLPAAGSGLDDDEFLASLEETDSAPEEDSDDYDPLAELAGLEEARSEARESDIFDSEDEEPGPRPFAGAAPEADNRGDDADLIDTLDSMAADEEATTSDYIARARRAAMAAADTHKAVRRSAAAPLAAPKPRGIGKAPLYLAASAVVLTGAGAGTYLYLRGKQAPDPALSGPVDTYVDPVFAAATPEPAPSPREAYSEFAAMGGPAADEGDLFDMGYLAAMEADIFQEETAPETAPETAQPESTGTLAALTPAPAVSYPPIPAIVTVESEANAGNAIAQYQLAQSLRAGGDLDTAIPLLRRAALKGIAPAQYDLGKIYELGQGVDQDLIQARSLIARAAEQGHVGAMYDLALFMAEGEGGPADEAGAAEWFRRAADHGFTDAQYNLGVMYAEGIGVEQDPGDALYWFELAARQGDGGAALEVRNLSARLPEAVVSDVRQLADRWEEAPAMALANGRFGAQRWNTGNPLQVQAVQTALSRLGYLGGEADGVLGPQTAAAIRDYQRSENLPVTGTVTPQLIDRLNAGAAPGRG